MDTANTSRGSLFAWVIGLFLKFRFLTLAFMVAFAPSADAGDKGRAEPIDLSTSPVALNPDDPNEHRVGRLIWRGGLEISSDDEHFGGWSGLLVSADGTELLAVSDKGRWFSARLRYDSAGDLIGLDRARMARLRDLDGEVLRKKKWRDAESLAVLDDGTNLVGFEREHRIWRYGSSAGTLDASPTEWPGPNGLDEIPANKGLEALVALQDGGLLALAQEHDDDTNRGGFLWQDGRWSELTYDRRDDLKTKGATRLPGGDVLVLERGKLASSDVAVRLVRVASPGIRPGATLKGREVASWRMPFSVDNFEGVAAREGSQGETLIYLISDNHFDEDERTVLFLFELED